MRSHLERLRYPIGRFEPPKVVTAEHVAEWISDVERLPRDLRRRVEGLRPQQLENPYRPGGWTVRQVVHHLADSHLNSYVRFKWALTEDRPAIKTYYEDRWAELADYGQPVRASLDFLDLLHRRWVVLLRSLTPEQLRREFLHPEQGVVRLDVNIGIYAWHGRHHLAHVDAGVRQTVW